MSNAEQELLFFHAIEEQNIQLVEKMLANGAQVNILNVEGTALYRAVKLNNYELVKLLIEKGADLNIVHISNKGSGNDNPSPSCSLSTPIDWLRDQDEDTYDNVHKYLLENRPMVNGDTINQRIHYCTQLFNDRNHEMLFDYAATYLLRENMYTYIQRSEGTGLALAAATLNIEARFNGVPVESSGFHQAYFMLLIRSLFEELVHFKLGQSHHIESYQQYMHVFYELLHNIEAYNLLKDIDSIPYRRRESFYPAIAKNLIQKLKNMKNHGEYTLPIYWTGHALCVNFIRAANGVIIRIDNLYSGEKDEHVHHRNDENVLVIIPKIIGKIPLKNLDDNEDYFISLLTWMRKSGSRKDGIAKLYHNRKLRYLDTRQNLEMTNQLNEKAKDFKYFIEQAQNNCFIKCHEPGFMIRSDDYITSAKILTILRAYTATLTTKVITQKQDDLTRNLVDFWNEEMNISAIKATRFEVIRQIYKEYCIKRIINPAKVVPIEQSYINLAVVKIKEQNEKEKKLRGAKDMDVIISTYEEIYGTKTVIEVKDMFKECKNKKQQVLVLGRAGIGKTTFCQYVAHQWSNGDIWPQFDLVILISLRNLTETRYRARRRPYRLIDLVKKEYYSCISFPPEHETFIEKQCADPDNSRILWLLDGYDEFAPSMPEHLKDLFEGLRTTHHHIITSRPYLNTLPHAVKMEITGFTDNNIENYVKQFFDHIEDKSYDASSRSKDLLNFLKSKPSIWGVAHIPINLELICNIWTNVDWSKTKELTMTALYDNIIEWICRQYLTKQKNESIQMTKKKIYKNCSTELSFLETLAFKAMENSTIILQSDLLEQTFDMMRISPKDRTRFLNIGILKSLDDQQTGNHIETSKDHYFVHLSFQEHFAAQYLVNALKGTSSQQELAIKFIKNSKYHQRYVLVFTFAAGLLVDNYYESCRNTFWNALLEEPRDLVGLRHFELIVSCLEEANLEDTFRRHPKLLRYLIKYIEDTTSKGHYWFNSQWRHLADLLKRSPSLLCEKSIMKVLEQLTNSKNMDVACNTLRMIPRMIELNVNVNENCKLISLLVKALRRTDEGVKLEVCWVLRDMGKQAAKNDVISELVTALLESCEDVKEFACQALGEMGEEAAKDDVISALVTALLESSDEVKKSACEALGKMGENAAQKNVISALATTLTNRNLSDRLRWSVCRAMEYMCEKAAGNNVISALVTELLKGSKSDKRHVCDALETMSSKVATPEAISVLITAILKGDQSAKGSACIALGGMGEKAATHEVITALMALTMDQDQNTLVKENACRALGMIGRKPRNPEAVSALKTILQDQHLNETIRASACYALGEIDQETVTKEVINVWVDMLGDESSSVKTAVCNVLGEMDRNSATDEIILKLQTVFLKGKQSVKESVCEALEKMGEKAARYDVIGTLVVAFMDRNQDERLKRRVCGTLGKMGEKAAENYVVSALVIAFSEGSENVKESVCEALGEMGESAARYDVIGTLVVALMDRNQDERLKRRVCRTLGKMGEKAAQDNVIDALLTMLTDPNQSVWLKHTVCEILGKMSEKVAQDNVISALLTAFSKGSESVKKSACKTLGEMGEKAAQDNVIGALLTTLTDPNQSVWLKHTVCETLGKMSEKAAQDNVIGALLTTFTDPNQSVWLKHTVCETLGKMSEKAAQDNVISALVTASEGSESIKKSACEALGKMGENAAQENVISALVTMLTDQSDGVQMNYPFGGIISRSAEELNNYIGTALWRIIERTPTRKMIKVLVATFNAQIVQIQERKGSGMNYPEIEYWMENCSNGIASVCQFLGKMDLKPEIDKVNDELMLFIRRFKCVPYPGMRDWLKMTVGIFERACEALEKITERPIVGGVIDDLIYIIFMTQNLLNHRDNNNRKKRKLFEIKELLVSNVFSTLMEISEKVALIDVISRLEPDVIKIIAKSEHWQYYLDTVPAEKLIEVFFKTGDQTLLPAITRVTFEERHAVTFTEECVVVYGNKEPVVVTVTNSEYCQQLTKAFNDLRKET